MIKRILIFWKNLFPDPEVQNMIKGGQIKMRKSSSSPGIELAKRKPEENQ